MITVAQIIDKVSEGKSRVAILDGLGLYLRTNFIASDQGPPEMTFTRTDHALVPQEHIASFLLSLDDLIRETRDEIANWEKLLVVDSEAEVTNSKQKRKKVGREQLQAARQHPNRPASRNDRSEDDGQLA